MQNIKRSSTVYFVMLLSLGLNKTLIGATVTWSVASGNWFTNTNWTPNQVPGSSDDAIIQGATNTQVNVTGGVVGANSVTIGPLGSSVTGAIVLFFSGTASAGATIYNINGAIPSSATTSPVVISFLGNSTAQTAQFNVVGVNNGLYQYNDATLAFTGSTNADRARINVSNGAGLVFNTNATAGTANITNGYNGLTHFLGNSSAGNATITNNINGVTAFRDNADGSGATIINNGNSAVDISFTNTGTGIGSLSGSGNVYLGARILTLGALNRNDTISGVIQDGISTQYETYEQYRGDPLPADIIGGALTKVGSGILTLSGMNTYTGATTVSGGTLAAAATNTFSPSSAFSVATTTILDLQGFSQTVASLSNNGLVRIAGAGAGAALAITGNYSSIDGLLSVNTSLGNDNSLTDRLIVSGDTSGETSIQVTNIGGNGALTTNGIKIVDVAGASNGVFRLIGDYTFEGEPAVVGGAYAYRLYKNGITSPNDGDWYLRSSALSAPGQPGAPLYQPGVPVYEVYTNSLQLFNMPGALQQRVGNRSWRDTETELQSIQNEGFWGRIDGNHAVFKPTYTTANSRYDANLFKMQLGADKQLYENSHGVLIGGLSGRYGTIKSDVQSFYSQGNIDTTAYGPTGTITWYGVNGFYVDGQANGAWYDSDLKSRSANLVLVNDNDASGYALSIESGKRINLNPNWSVTPQSQLTYSNVAFDRFLDVFNADVSSNKGESLLGRLGLSADYQNKHENKKGSTERTHLYGVTNLYYDFLNEYQINVSQTPLSYENPQLWGGLGIGGSNYWNNDMYSLYGEASINTSLAHFGDSYVVGGSVGLRAKWG